MGANLRFGAAGAAAVWAGMAITKTEWYQKQATDSPTGFLTKAAPYLAGAALVLVAHKFTKVV